MPGSKHAWPNNAPCWSPTIEAIGTAPPSRPGSVSPSTPDVGTIVGSSARGISNNSSSESFQCLVCRSNSIVREALLGSVACTRPAVSFQASHVSIVPKASSPRRARSRAPGMLSSSHSSFVAEKYASSTRPVRAWMSAARPCSSKARQRSWVRRSCQTMALASGLPVERSQRTVVSRWLVMAIARICAAVTGLPSTPFNSTLRITAS